MGQTLEIESLETLINAVNKYQDDLQTNYQILANAANVCDAAMGSDAIAQKHIANLNNALLQLSKTTKIVAQVAAELRTEKQEALDLLNDD